MAASSNSLSSLTPARSLDRPRKLFDSPMSLSLQRSCSFPLKSSRQPNLVALCCLNGSKDAGKDIPIEKKYPAFPTVMDINQIREILPHRFPFLLVDRVIEYNPGVSAVAIKNVTINDNFFPGHFPERPIMPGVLMVEVLGYAYDASCNSGDLGAFKILDFKFLDMLYDTLLDNGGMVLLGEPSLTISVDMVLLILDIRSDSRFDFEYRVQGAMAQVGGLVMLQPEVGGSRENFFFAGIDKVRFRKPVIAGDTLVMRMTLVKLQKRFGVAKMEGKAYVGGEVVCEGEFLMATGSE
ncbi:hypothetical protein FEM48_Zijuj08G0165900 [Ziziphus jujuba var. spinosa]|uniref:3-hydroxyacyl-[acyl-carrier-protein] dehydratase FabZ n=1 Tax=Ziziphus jujuba var. spinosa TaxID=714518 RepID=A0A978V070_ZIZJJ|nr:hypothetical protein FEM48_Zijuj08G0165900 [Ziziphus jujuba var. spinosa]